MNELGKRNLYLTTFYFWKKKKEYKNENQKQPRGDHYLCQKKKTNFLHYKLEKLGGMQKHKHGGKKSQKRKKKNRLQDEGERPPLPIWGRIGCFIR